MLPRESGLDLAHLGHVYPVLGLQLWHCGGVGASVDGFGDIVVVTGGAALARHESAELLTVVGALIALARSVGVEGGAKRVRRPAAWEVLCRLLAWMSSQRRSVAGTELTAVRAALYPERSFQAVHRKLAEDPLERGRSANAAYMLSSPKHVPLRVRLRPRGPEPEDPLDGEARWREAGCASQRRSAER